MLGVALHTIRPCSKVCVASDTCIGTMAPSKLQKMGIALTLQLEHTTQKRKRKCWVKEWLLKRKQFSHMNIIKELEPTDFKNYLRMDNDTFNELLCMVAPKIQKQDTVMRESVSVQEQLIVTLRFLATGATYEDLKFRAAVSPQLLSKIIPETCWAIYKSLKNKYIKMPTTETDWKAVAKKFEQKWNFNHCVGAMDGKHIAIQKPPGSGSSYYNYKHFFSHVLFAIVNADYEFMYVHTGTNGSVSDGAILQTTKFYEKLMSNELNLPQPGALPESDTLAPYVFLGDSAFAVNKHLMKPYSFKNISYEKRIFNYRLSRARRVVENAFGILAARFRIFRQSVGVHIDSTDPIILACCMLHNYLRKKSPSYITDTCVDSEDIQNVTFREGDWRQIGSFVPLQQLTVRQRNEEGNTVRNVFTNYFNGEGKISFQEKMMRVVQE